MTKSSSELLRLALELRKMISEKIADNIQETGLEIEEADAVLQDLKSKIRYLPFKNSPIVLILTNSTLHCSIRLVAAIIDTKLTGGIVNTTTVIERNNWLSQSSKITIIQPFFKEELECLGSDTIAHVLRTIEGLSTFECLVIMSILYERSHWEFILPRDGTLCHRELEITANLSFANEKGIFYTPIEVANLIVEKTLANLLPNDLSKLDKAGLMDFFKKLISQKILEPACGTSIFTLCFLRRLLEVFSTANYKDIPERVEYLKRIKTEIFDKVIYGIDIETKAIELSGISISLILGIPLRNEVTSSHISNGNLLVSSEILGSPLKPQEKSAKRKIDNFSNSFSITPFNWVENYPEVRLFDKAGGFDFIFLNPPYGRLKIHRSDFTDKETSSALEGVDLENEYITIQRYYQELANFFKASGDYELSCQGELDWYRLTLERALRLLKRGGRLGCIVPSSILADARATHLRKYLLDNCTIEWIMQIPESNGLFDTVNQPTCILIIQKTPKQKTEITFVKCKDFNNIIDMSIKVSLDVIKILDPMSLPIPFIDNKSLTIINKIYRYQTIGETTFIVNKRGELDLTAYKKYLSSDKKDIPLIRGHAIERFIWQRNADNKLSSVRNEFIQLLSSERTEHIKHERIVGRQCAYLDKKRRLSFSIVPTNTIVSNSCNYLFSLTTEITDNFLLGLLNSALMEWRFRLTSSNNHVGNYEISRLPLPLPSDHPVFTGLIAECAIALTSHYSNKTFSVSKEPLCEEENTLDAAVFNLFGLSVDEASIVLTEVGEKERISAVSKEMQKINKYILFDHVAGKASDKEQEMIKYIPPGGNWRNIPESIPSKRLDQIRKMSKDRGGVNIRTTYYGRLRWDKPSYTISTYFSRIGNGCFIHPEQNRLISLREAARFQSFKDDFRFCGSKGSQYKQIGNAVPPLLALAIARTLGGKTMIAPFAGAGGLCMGFKMAGYDILAAQDIDENCLATLKTNDLCNAFVLGDITKNEIKQAFIKLAKQQANDKEIDVVAGGPPCCGFSMAGWYKRDDPRNELVYDFLDIVEALKPKCVMMENVQGLMWMKKGEVLKNLLQAIGKLGYQVSFQVLKAEEFGVPQLRRRVIIIGSRLGSPKFPKPIFGNTGLQVCKPFTVKDAISDLSHVEPAKENDEIRYSEKWLESDYQKWVRGLISFDELINLRKFPWVQ